MYAVGGFASRRYLQTVEVFDPVTSKWRASASLPAPRAGASVAEMGGEVYALGGEDGAGGLLASCLRFDTCTGEWEAIAELAVARRDAGAVVV